MNVSVLLRLIPPERTGGRLAGQAELVETGETAVFADHDEMIAFLQRASASGGDTLDPAVADSLPEAAGWLRQPLDVYDTPGP